LLDITSEIDIFQFLVYKHNVPVPYHLAHPQLYTYSSLANATNVSYKEKKNNTAATFKIKVKVKFTLEQDTKAQRWSRGIPLLFL
jgi:hypothetical protein